VWEIGMTTHHLRNTLGTALFLGMGIGAAYAMRRLGKGRHARDLDDLFNTGDGDAFPPWDVDDAYDEIFLAEEVGPDGLPVVIGVADVFSSPLMSTSRPAMASADAIETGLGDEDGLSWTEALRTVAAEQGRVSARSLARGTEPPPEMPRVGDIDIDLVAGDTLVDAPAEDALAGPPPLEGELPLGVRSGLIDRRPGR
jgi:hypothetical protein